MSELRKTVHNIGTGGEQHVKQQQLKQSSCTWCTGST